MSEWFSSPRASKRLRLEGADQVSLSSIVPTKRSASILSTVPSGLTGLSQKFLESRKSKSSEVQQEDSTYGSKEDSLVEEDSAVPEDDVTVVNLPHTKAGAEDVHYSNAAARQTSSRKRTPSRKAIAETASTDPRSQDRSQKSNNRLKRRSPQADEDLQLDAEDRPVKMLSSKKGSEKQKRRHTGDVPSREEAHDSSTNAVQGGNDHEPKRTEQTLLRGILTPTRGYRISKRKSVAFEEKQTEQDLGFKDIRSPRTLEIPESPPTKLVECLELELRVLAQTTLELENADEGRSRDLPNPVPATISEPPNRLEIQNALSGTDINDDDHITAIKSTVLSKLTSRMRLQKPPTRLQSQYDSLQSILTATITSGESNSMIMLGSRGSGKSMLVECALSELSSNFGDNFHVVKLNGFVQTDDKLALREIWRQLGREMDVPDNEMEEVGSYADTMTTLLGLLSHPEELQDPNLMQLDVDPAEGVRTSKSVIFILDEFDLFTNHSRQTLLYNLFDIAQSRKAPIAVIGCSTRMDIVDCLEKRVKSRFSHRWVHVPSIKNVKEWEQALGEVLIVEVDERLLLAGSTKEDLLWRSRWNAHIQDHFLRSSQIQSILQQVFYSTKSLPDLFAALHLPIASLRISHPGVENVENGQVNARKSHLKGRSQSKSAKPDSLSVEPDSQQILKQFKPVTLFSVQSPSVLTLLPQLPLLHLALLAASVRLESIYNIPSVTFAAVYGHYLDLIAKAKTHASGSVSTAGMRTWGRDMARRAWEELANWELLVGGTKGEETRAAFGIGNEGRMWRVDVTLEEVGWAVKRKTELEKRSNAGSATSVAQLVSRWCREI